MIRDNYSIAGEKTSWTIVPAVLLCLLIFAAVMTRPALSQKPATSQNPEHFSWSNFPWQSQLNRTHPLNGKIWSVKDKKYISSSELITALKQHRYIGLGETHDNPDHHILQAWIIDQIAKNGKRKPDIVMEMIDEGQKTALQNYLAQKQPTLKGLRDVLKWQKSGWPDWSLYAPIAQTALEANLTIRAGNPTRALGKKIGRQGYDVLGETRKNKLQLHQPLPDVLAKDLSQQIVTGHCNMMPASATKPMERIQRLRDAVMAENLLKSTKLDGAILIAGSGHVRADRGVPWYMAQAGKKMVSVIMIESHEEETASPVALAPQAPKGYKIADYIWITPRTEREDPCEQFKKFMKRKHKPSTPKAR